MIRTMSLALKTIQDVFSQATEFPESFMTITMVNVYIYWIFNKIL